MEVERWVGRSSLSRGVVVPVRQNPTDGDGLSDESDDFHLGSASAGQRVDVIDFVDELRPSFSHGAFRRGGFSGTSGFRFDFRRAIRFILDSSIYATSRSRGTMTNRKRCWISFTR